MCNKISCIYFPSVEGVEKGEEEEEKETDEEESEEEEEEGEEVKSKDRKQYMAPSAMPAADIEDEEVHMYSIMYTYRYIHVRTCVCTLYMVY